MSAPKIPCGIQDTGDIQVYDYGQEIRKPRRRKPE
jgi:hypothetical protein